MSYNPQVMLRRHGLPSPFLLLAIHSLVLSVLYAHSNPDNQRIPERIFDVRSYGAAGDGTHYDGIAVQDAIDACTRGGGGEVLLDNGTFLCGGIVLKDNVDFHLTSTATLIGTPDLSKYNQDSRFHYKNSICSFIYSYGASHVSITGGGTIDGHGTLFGANNSYSARPQLILFRECKDIHVADVFITNSGMFDIWLIRCHRVRVDGIRILSVAALNNDGIDIDSSQDVYIENSNIRTLDDSIAFKSSEKDFPCRDVVITNCILSSCCAAIRIGPDASADIENIVVSNCVIRDTGLNGIKIEESMGAAIRNITFSNLVLDNVKGPFSIRCAGWNTGPDMVPWKHFNDSEWEHGKLENILFANITAMVPRTIVMRPELESTRAGWLNYTDLNLGISITGTSKTRPRRITFSNVDITFAGGGTASEGARRNVPDLERAYPEMFMFGDLPAYGLYMHHVSGVTLNNVQFHLANEDLRPAIVCNDVDDLELAGFKAEGSKNAESLIRLENSRWVLINASRPLNRISTFLRVEGAQSGEIRLVGTRNDLSDKIWESTSETEPNAVSIER